MSTPQDPVAERRATLDERLQGYHGHGLADVLELLDYLREDGDSVIAGGSLSIGLGNALSDLDMVLVGPNTRTSAVPLQHWIERLRVDGWTRSVADVDALFAEAEAALLAPTPLLRAFGNTEQEQQLKLLHRIAFGVPIDGPPVQPGSTSRGAQAVAADLLTREYAERLRESALVATLALAAGRLRTAAFSARQAVEEALHAVLHARGVPFTGDKWLQEQLHGHDDLQALHERVLDLPPVDDAAAVGAFTEEALRTAEGLTGLPTALAAAAAGLHWKVAADLVLLPLSGEPTLVGPAAGAAWTLTEPQAAAWTDLAGAGHDGRLPHPAGDERALALCLRLHELGVATPTWEAGIPLASLTLDREAAV